MIRARYSPIMDKIARKIPLKNESKTTTDVHPGTMALIRIFFVIKYNPMQNENNEMIMPKEVKSLSGREV